MGKIGVTLIMRAKPGKGDALADFWQQVAVDVPAQEPGCLQVSVVRNAADPDEFVIFEIYASEADFAAHNDTDYARALRPTLEPLRVAPIQRIVGSLIA